MIENIRKDGSVIYDMTGVQVPISRTTEVAYQILEQVINEQQLGESAQEATA